MIRLHASYGQKIPGTREYSSESFHASAEIEVADTVQGEALKSALNRLWTDLRLAVHQQMSNGEPSGRHEPRNRIAPNGHPGNGNGQETATKKQIGYLLALTRRKLGFSAEQTRNWLSSERGLNLNDLTKAQAAALIDEFNETRSRA